MTAVVDTMQDQEFHGHLNLGVWKRLLRFAGPYRRLLWRLAFLGIFMGLMRVAFTVLTWAILHELETTASRMWIGGFGAVYFLTVVVWSGAVGIFIRTAGRLSTDFSHDIREASFEHLQNLSFAYYDRRAAGWLVARLTSDCDRLARTISWSFLDLIWGPTLIVGLGIAMLLINAKLAAVMLSLLAPLAVVSFFFQRWLLRISRRVRKQNSTITASFGECIQGVRTTKALVREDENLSEFRGQTRDMYRYSVRNVVLSNAYFPIVFGLMSIATGLVLWVGGVDVRENAGVQLGTLVLFMWAAREFIWPVLDMSHVFAELQTAQAAAERIVGLLDTDPTVTDSPDVRRAIEAFGREDPDRAAAQGLAEDGLPDRIEQIEFRNISFEYLANQAVLHDFSLTVRRGQTVALVGPTGGGKTTIISLMCRFYEPTGGQILIDGVDYCDRSLHWLQSNLGIVLQEPRLFSETVRENIRYGRLDATDEQVVAAAELVHADAFIRGLDQGYDTPVGEGGGRLSTGQKQLVSFARAVLADPRIFVMDEATSSVDTETEQLIQRGLAAVLSGRISFIIAHRLSTVRAADVILLIDEGRVIEQGSHRDLMAARGRYYHLYTNQFAEERTSEILGRRFET